MEQLFNLYKNSYINLNAKNKSLVLKKLTSRKHFDLTNINTLFSSTKSNLVDFLISRNDNKLFLFSSIENPELHLTFKNLNKEIITLFKERGVYDLYIGNLFYTGFIKENYINAPLLLFPVELLEQNGNWYLINRNENIKINTTFILAYQQFNNIKINEFDLEISSLDSNYISAVIDYLKLNNINLDIKNINNNPAQFNYELLGLNNYFVLGQFSNSQSSIMQDYIQLMNAEITDGALFNLLNNKKSVSIDKEYSPVLISSLDKSQEQAVIEANNQDNLIIYGPPGTGKSETISNIIADSISQNKKVLLVSQKKAALDVVYNKLNKMNLAYVTSYITSDSDQKDLYTKISKNLNTDIGYKYKAINPTLKHRLIEYQNKNYNSYFKTLSYNGNFLFNNLTNTFDFNKIRKHTDFLNQFHIYENITGSILPEIEKISKYILDYIKEINSNKEFFNLLIKILIENKDLFSIFKNSDLLKKIIDLFLNDNYKFDNYIKAINNKSIFSFITYFKAKSFFKEFLLEYSLKELNIIKDLLEEYFKFPLNFFHLSDVDNFINFFSMHNLFIKLYDFSQLELHLLETTFSLAKENILQLNKSKEFYINYYLEVFLKETNGTFIDNIRSVSERYGFSFNNYNKYNKDLIKLVDDYNTLVNNTDRFKDNSRYIYSNIISKIQSKKYYAKKTELTYKDLTLEINKKRKRLSLRQFVHQFKNKELFEIMPCWLMTPEMVSSILPLVKDLFDVVIFDEASQIYIENSLPAIYRGKKIIVAGDDKQLKPTSTFESKITEEVDHYFLDNESLFDIAKVNYKNVHLQTHYRSKNSQLIEFSNKHFYGNIMQIIPNKNVYTNEAIKLVKVDGTLINRKNEIEADEVVDILCKIFESKEDKSIGIIAFSISQKEAIEKAIEEKIKINATFAYEYLKQEQKFESIFIKNIENVQGDERDIIIFSTGYAPDETGKLSLHFGSLNQSGGENRLNVAITRAKEKIYLITSIQSNELNTDNLKNEGPKLFKKYLEYVENLNLNIQQYESIDTINPSFLRNLRKELENKYEVICNYNVSNCNLDIAIINRYTGNIDLVVLFDNNIIDDFIYKYNLLSKTYSNIIRYSYAGLYLDSKDLFDNIIYKLNRLDYFN